MMTKGYIFDYGGTLDTGGCHWGKVLWHAYEKCSAPVSEEMFRKAYVYGERTLATRRIILPGMTFRDTLDKKITLQMGWLKENAALCNCGKLHDAILEEAYAKARMSTADAHNVLTEIAKHAPMVLVSNFYGNISDVLKEFGLDSLFCHIIESAVVGVRKPDPKIFALGVECLGMKPEDITVVGDSYDKDIVPANSIGCHTVWIKGEGWTDEEQPNPVADRIITNLCELLDDDAQQSGAGSYNNCK